MMPAAKHGDPQFGIDVHLCTVPPSPSPVPLPTPHMSIVFDPMDYLPFIGATVTVCGMKRAVAGTVGKAVHIPPGFPFAPKYPSREDELFMGSATVEADGDPFSFLSVPVLSCQVAGMRSPRRPRRKGGPRSSLLPTVFNLAIPTNVFIGGPPTISLFALASKLAFGGLGKLAKSRFARALGKRFRDWRKVKFSHLNPGFLKCAILRAEPVNIVTGAVSIEQEDFTLPGLIPIRWTRRYASDNPRRGACGVGWECPADARLEHDAESGIVLFHHPEGGIAIFPTLPQAEGEEGAVLELMDGALLSDHGAELRVRTKEDRIYRFPKAVALNKGEQWEYPLVQVQDLCGNTLTYERSGGRLVAIREATGRRIEIESNADGLIRRVMLHVPKNGFRHVFVEYEQDATADLVEVRDALGNPYRFVYEQHHMLRHTDRNGLSFYYEYERLSEDWRVVRSWGDGGLYTYSFAYLDAVNERRIANSLGHVSLVKLDERGLPIGEIDPLGGKTTYEYDEAGRSVAVVDQDGHRTQYEYDERGCLTTHVRADGTAIRWTLDNDCRVTCVTDANGAQWFQEFDSRGLLTCQSTPEGAERRYHYDARGCLVGFSSPLGAWTRIEADTYGDPSLIVDAAGHAVRLDHDQFGNLVTLTDALGRVTRYEYDAMGRVTLVALPSGASAVFAYDAEGNLTRHVDPNGVPTRFDYCGIGQLRSRLLPAGGTVQYVYDTEERLVAVRNQRGEEFRLKRDALGRVVEEVDYWGQPKHYSYTAAGHIKTSKNALGHTIHCETDALGRVIRRFLARHDASAEGETEAYFYDNNGNLVACENAAIRIIRRFDTEGRLVEERQGDEFAVACEYDANGNIVARTTSLRVGEQTINNATRFTYDTLGRLTRLEVDGLAPLRREYNALGQVIGDRFGTAIRRSFAYTLDGDLAVQRVLGGHGLLFEQIYSYDAKGNLVERQDSVLGTERYSYDPVGVLLARLSADNGLTRYVCDAAGERLYAPYDAVPLDIQAVDPWTRVREHEGLLYGFDRTGNLVERAGPENSTRFVWNVDQRLVESESGGRRTLYRYDPLGRRISKESGGAIVRFFWSGDLLIGESVAENVQDRWLGGQREWIYDPGTATPLVMIDRRAVPLYDQRNESLYLVHTDPNGCPTRLIDMSGSVVWAAQLGGWGEVERLQVQEIQNPIRLQGQYEDVETGLHYNRFRYYDPRIGQFISQDPLALAAGENLYRFAPNIWGWVDPLGLACFDRAANTFVDPSSGAVVASARHRGNFPLTGGPPGGVLFRADASGAVTHFAEYDASGMITKRVDITGAAHRGVPTPHVLDYGRNVDPSGTVHPKAPKVVRPTDARDIR